MKTLMTFAAFLLLAVPAFAQAPEGEAMPAMPEMGRPAEMDALAYFHGNWDVTMEFKMDVTATEWTKAAGTSTVTPMLDGCIDKMTFDSKMMGMAFSGIDMTTYNREYKRYESVWFDNMGGKMSVMHGNFEGDKLVMTGNDKMMGMEYMVRSVSQKKSNDEVYWTMAMSMDEGKTWMENMRMTYKRKM